MMFLSFTITLFPSSFLTPLTNTEKSNKYMVPTFNANKKCKLSLMWFKQVNTKKINNNKVGKFEAPSHNIPKIYIL